MAVSRRTKQGGKELPHVQGQGQRPGVPGCDVAGTAERSYPVSEVSGSREELPRLRGHGRRPGGDTLRPRSGAAAKRSYPASEVSGGQEETPCSKVRVAAGRIYPASEASGGWEETSHV